MSSGKRHKPGAENFVIAREQGNSFNEAGSGNQFVSGVGTKIQLRAGLRNFRTDRDDGQLT
jgi:hypothetical protein